MRVGIVTVGDELLTGDTVNHNAAWLGRRLADRGVDVERVTVVPDERGDIAAVVNENHAAFDAVIVTGGLGPTHDDVTVEGVAAAFGQPVEVHDDALAWLEDGGYHREDLAEGTAHLPRNARLLPNPEGVAPGFVIDNCYVLPGVPDEMHATFELVADEFAGEPRHVVVVEVDEPESALLERVADLRERFDVSVGSYPGETVSLRLTGGDEAEVAAATEWLRERARTVPE
jgi:molybdenum cofactor synthesis domain-containing protein